MFTVKIKVLYKEFTRKNNLFFSSGFNITLGNKDKSTGNKGFYESQKELMSLNMEFDLEDLWRRQSLNSLTHVLSWQEQYLISY